MIATMPTRTRPISNGLTCFQSDVPFGCSGCPLSTTLSADGRVLVGPDDVLRYVTNGAMLCPRCRAPVDLRDQFAHWSVFGSPEGLFGLQTWLATRPIPATTQPQVITWDVGLDIPYSGAIVYANITNMGSGGPDEWVSLLLWNQSLHAPWPTCFRFLVPAGGERGLSLLVVVKPFEPPLPLPLEIALQGVDAFHRGQFGVSAIMLASAIEAALRPRLEALYDARGVKLPAKEIGFMSLLERARLLLDPQPGPKLVGSLKELAQVGRNLAAHGQTADLNREQVAGWMVDVAAVYEWVQRATHNGQAPPP
jgi:hypothetical protein